MRTSFKSDIVKNYLRKYPNMLSNTLANKIYSEMSEHFTDKENVRSTIRYVRGLSGKKNRKSKTIKEFKVKPFSLLKNPFNLPHSYAEKPKIFNLPNDHNNILFISDLHIPFHDVKAITTALNYGKENSINAIFINGDIIDFYQISRFQNVERKRSVSQELKATNHILDVFNKEFPNIPIYFLLGNHDVRLEKFLAVKAPELLDVAEFKLEMLLHAKAHNMMVIGENTLVRMGKLSVTHGHLLMRGFFAPVNAARGTFLRAKASTIISHVHKVSTHTETTINGKQIVCYSTGCLCELNPTYNPFANNFSHGFAHVMFNKAGNYTVRNLQILDGIIVS